MITVLKMFVNVLTDLFSPLIQVFNSITGKNARFERDLARQAAMDYLISWDIARIKIKALEKLLKENGFESVGYGGDLYWRKKK